MAVQPNCLKGRAVCGTVYGEMHLKDLLGSFVRVGYRIPVPDFYLVLHGLRCRKSTIMDNPERIIGLLKNHFTILKCPICIKSIQQITNEIHDDDVASIDKIVKVCAVLLNFGESIVHK